MLYYLIMARKPAKKTKDSTQSIQDNRVMLGARIDKDLAREMKKWGIDHDMTSREIIEQAIKEFIRKK